MSAKTRVLIDDPVQLAAHYGLALDPKYLTPHAERRPEMTHWTREGVDRYVSQCRTKDEARFALSSVIDELIAERDALLAERNQYRQAARDYAADLGELKQALTDASAEATPVIGALR